MLISGIKVTKLVSKWDETKYKNDALQFFYGDEEPYSVVEDYEFPMWSSDAAFLPFVQFNNPTLLANDLVAVQPMNEPLGVLTYASYDYTYEAPAVERPHFKVNEVKHNRHTKIPKNKIYHKPKGGNFNLFKRQFR